MTDELTELLGQTAVAVTGEPGDEQMVFSLADGRRVVFWHDQDCCESVYIEDVNGNLADLVGSPLIQAEATGSDDPPPGDRTYVDSYTWTFYRFATQKGGVVVRWYGESNGYYSEGVSMRVEPSGSVGYTP